MHVLKSCELCTNVSFALHGVFYLMKFDEASVSLNETFNPWNLTLLGFENYTTRATCIVCKPCTVQVSCCTLRLGGFTWQKGFCPWCFVLLGLHNKCNLLCIVCKLFFRGFTNTVMVSIGRKTLFGIFWDYLRIMYIRMIFSASIPIAKWCSHAQDVVSFFHFVKQMETAQNVINSINVKEIQLNISELL